MNMNLTMVLSLGPTVAAYCLYQFKSLSSSKLVSGPGVMHSSTSALDIANSPLLQSPIYWHHGWNNLQNSAVTRIVLQPRWCKYTSHCSSPPCHHRPSQNLKIKPSHWKPNRGRNITSKDPKVAIKRPSWLTSEDPNTRLGSGELVPVPRTNCEMLDWSTHNQHQAA